MSGREELRVLAHRMADATASPADASRLSELLRSRPDFHDEYLGFLDTHAALCWAFRGSQADHFEASLFPESAAESYGGARRSGTSPWRRRVGWFAAVAVLLMVAFLIGRWQNSALASPTLLVRAAIETHREPIERVYVVTVEPNLPSAPGGTALRDVRIATQGDRFWMETTRNDMPWVWGRDLDGAIWLTVASKWVIRIEPDEIGPSLQAVSDVYCLELDTLLNNVLNTCRLKRSAESDSSYAITATPSWLWRNRVRVREMTIECDRETRAIRRLVVHRQVPPHGEVTTTFTLVDARPADASRYRPEGHLTPPYEILSRDSDDARRREILSNWFGSERDRWVKPLPGTNAPTSNVRNSK